MATLDYQNRDDSLKEKPGLLSIFGPSHVKIWEQLAEQIGGSVLKGSWLCGSKLIATVGAWQVTLDLHTESSGESSTTYTQLRAPYVNRDGFRFNVYRASIFTTIAEKLGFSDVQVGQPQFDKEFVIKGNSPEQLRKLFSNPRLRSMLRVQRSVHFSVKDDEGWVTKRFPEGVDELEFRTIGVIKDISRLQLMFNLFGETLNTLCHIGSAYENDPGIVLD